MPSAPKTTPIAFRDLEAIDEIKALEDLQIEAWGDDERDIVPLNQFVAARYVGGSLIGAFDGKDLSVSCMAFTVTSADESCTIRTCSRYVPVTVITTSVFV
jgi:predicted GNAT superfamily acetyltransferase